MIFYESYARSQNLYAFTQTLYSIILDISRGRGGSIMQSSHTRCVTNASHPPREETHDFQVKALNSGLSFSFLEMPLGNSHLQPGPWHTWLLSPADKFPTYSGAISKSGVPCRNAAQSLPTPLHPLTTCVLMSHPAPPPLSLKSTRQCKNSCSRWSL